MILCELAITLISLIVSVVFFVISLSFPELPADPGGPALFPRLMCCVTGIMAVIYAVQLLGNRNKREEITQALASFRQVGAQSPEGMLARRRLYVIGLSAVYPLLVVRIGFFLSTIVFLFAILKTYKVQSLRAGAYSLALGYGVYYCFAEILRAYIPTGVWLSRWLG